MPEFQYTTVPGKIAPFFNKIRTAGVPTKTTVQWLKALGFTSSNDMSLLTIAKAIGFTDQSGVPTDTWRHYRGANHKAVMAEAIRTGYRSLFEVYPDAQQHPDRELEHFFSTHSTAGQQAIAKTISTFKNLIVLADFAAGPGPAHASSSGAAVASSAPSTGTAAAAFHPAPPTVPASNPAVHLDVQIHISPESTPEQIEQIFSSMAKHLYGR